MNTPAAAPAVTPLPDSLRYRNAALAAAIDTEEAATCAGDWPADEPDRIREQVEAAKLSWRAAERNAGLAMDAAITEMKHAFRNGAAGLSGERNARQAARDAASAAAAAKLSYMDARESLQAAREGESYFN